MWQRKLAVLAITILAGVGSVHADELADIKARGTLVCGTQNASEPYAFPDPATRQIVGFDVDVCHALAQGLGVKLEHRTLSTDARIPELKTHRVDVLAAAMAWLPARAAQVDYSDQYYVAPIRVLVRADSPIQNLDQLSGKKIAASEGSSSAAVSVTRLPNSNLLTFHDIPSAFLALQQGKVEGLVAGQNILARFANEAAQKKGGPQYRMLAAPVYEERWGVVMNKNEPALMSAVNKILHEYDKSNGLQQSFDKWLGVNSPYKFTRDYRVEPIRTQ
ncbi:transporter substrate-binding domain-containing protein [Paraburkholderia susongensis]|uniref:Amino acid ABC transporter substrate-binding protein, PAAT family n=1 Tax=Paraburkholderia susongensis TaxID=1515439 RepID=A0A1X7LVF0_9BURK|nr:transporter substrate-binding domain-containing protein [Paraburkholderia susongensis]SMG57858.1 amino acid ABC transporter substrate-binding protein, PAAT family [Paraburkholderia susongensis]